MWLSRSARQFVRQSWLLTAAFKASSTGGGVTGAKQSWQRIFDPQCQ